MKKISYIFIFLFFLINSSSTKINIEKRGQKIFTYILKDGETLIIDTLVSANSPFTLIKENNFPKLNSAIIRSFENDSNNVKDFITYTNLISENRNLGYWSLIPNVVYAENFSDAGPQQGFGGNFAGFVNNGHLVLKDRVSDYRYGFYDQGSGFNWPKIEGFGNYYHKIFQNKTARKILIEQAIDIVISLCKTFPSDFKNSVLKELETLLVFSNSIKSMNANTDTDKFNDYWKGFLFRRNKIDNVPIIEIQDYILKAKNQIMDLDVSKNADAMYEISINNNIKLFYSIDKTVLYSNVSKNEISFDKNTILKSVKYLRDDKEEYYSFEGVKNGKQISLLFDGLLKEIK
jgi:hypothetical protein